MSDVISVLLRSLFSGCQSRRLLLLENLAPRHQLTVLKRQARKPKLRRADRLLWLTLRRLWPDWQKGLLLFQPQTVFAWHSSRPGPQARTLHTPIVGLRELTIRHEARRLADKIDLVVERVKP